MAADLRLTALSIATSHFVSGQPRLFTTSCRVVNNGTDAANQFRVFYSAGDSRLTSAGLVTLPYSVQVERLGAGQTVYISRSLLVPAGSDLAAYIQVDPEGTPASQATLQQFHLVDSPVHLERWVSIGPTRMLDGNMGKTGRVTALAIEPTASQTWYAGALNCGIWKTIDAGGSWMPIGDSLPRAGELDALALTSTPGRLYAYIHGAGLFRSDDGGTTWLQRTEALGNVTRITAHPADVRIVYAAADRGLFRVVDGYGDRAESPILTRTGSARDVLIHPAQPHRVYAAMSGDAIYVSKNGAPSSNADWTRLTGGLPSPLPGDRIRLAMHRSMPARLYAALDWNAAHRCSIYGTNNGGESWSELATRDDYPDALSADPVDSCHVYVGGGYFGVSSDGGHNFTDTLHGGWSNLDAHAIVIDPANPANVFVGSDHGLFRSPTHAAGGWQLVSAGMSNAEIYDLANSTSRETPVLIGTQDNGAARYDGSSEWRNVSGGDRELVAIAPDDERIFYEAGQDVSTLERSLDGGATWTGIAAELPTAPIAFAGCESYQLQVVVPTGSLDVLATSSSLWLKVANDSFTEVLTPAAGRIVRVLAARGEYFAGGSDGALYVGLGGSISWTRRYTFPAGVRVMAQGDNSSFFVALESGRVYYVRPSNDLVQVSDVTQGLPTVTINAMAADLIIPQTLYVGTENQGVFRCQQIQGIWQWSEFNDGLPLGRVSSLRAHRNAAIIRVAFYGRGVYEAQTDFPVGMLVSVDTRITSIDLDELTKQVRVGVDAKPWKRLSIDLSETEHNSAPRSMIMLLRDAFWHDGVVRLDYFNDTIMTGRILRIARIS